jgi:lipoate-protein ligase A
VTAPWRLIVDDGPADGAWNMALDRAVQLAREAGEVPPTLRLYSWKRPTVSLGRFQDPSGVDLGFCADNGIDSVRRFTGGRGVLHDDEVTYALVASVADGVPRGTAASYRWLSAGLVGAYRELGLEAELTTRPRGSGSSAACYLHATQADLSLGAMKLSGSAQVWSGTTVLQHGSFTLTRDVGREASVFRLDEGATARLEDETATIVGVLGTRPNPGEVSDAVVRGVSEGLGIALERGEYTPEELRRAAQLLSEVCA